MRRWMFIAALSAALLAVPLWAQRGGGADMVEWAVAEPVAGSPVTAGADLWALHVARIGVAASMAGTDMATLVIIPTTAAMVTGAIPGGVIAPVTDGAGGDIRGVGMVWRHRLV